MIETPLLHHFQGVTELPADVLIPASSCIEDVRGAGVKCMEKSERPAKAMKLLFSGGLEKYPGLRTLDNISALDLLPPVAARERDHRAL